MVTADVNDKITELAKQALAQSQGAGWIATAVMLLWNWYLAWRLEQETAKLQGYLLDASKARIDALHAEQVAAIKKIQDEIDKSHDNVIKTESDYQSTKQLVVLKLGEVAQAKARLDSLNHWEDLDALAQGK